MLKTMICMVASIMMAQPCQNLAKEEVIPQIIFETPEENDNRGPVIVSGYVDLSFNQAVLFFTLPLGNAEVRITNNDTGYYVEEGIIADTMVMIPFSCSEGQWSVVISVPGGPVYVGRFDIE